MRIAVTGTHRVGKSTLVEALAERLGVPAIDEPYALLEADGHEFADPPSSDDFEAQLRRSFAVIADAPTRVVLDRCPLDFLAYLRALDEDYDLEPWLDDVRDAMDAIDVVVFVPIESRIVVAASEDRRLRARVDEELRSIALDDALGLELEVIEVSGDLDARVQTVLRMLRSR